VKRPPATGTAKRKKARPVSADFSAISGGKKGFGEESMDGGRGGRREGRKSFVGEEKRVRSRSRAVSVDREKEEDFRESMPHRRVKDKTWWEGAPSVNGGGDGGGRRTPRRSSMKVYN
jgi:hypothetical protein